MCGLAICLGCGWFGLQVAGPLQDASRLHGENDTLERQLHKAEIQNQESEKQMRSIGTAQGAEAAARAKGYMLRTEHPLHLQMAPASGVQP